MVSGFLQAGMIPELFEQDRGDRKEDHAGYADRLVTGVECKKRDDRRQTDLLADKSRLKRLPREGRNGVEDQKGGPLRGVGKYLCSGSFSTRSHLYASNGSTCAACGSATVEHGKYYGNC